MKEYYFLSGKEQNGPFSIEELKTQNLTSETLIWTEGIESWQKLKDFPDLFQQIKYKSTPPPPPIEMEINYRGRGYRTIKINAERTPNPATERTSNSVIEAIKPSNRGLKFLIIWCSFHLFALLMSYSEVKIFNNWKPETEEFWPFVKIFEYHDRPDTWYGTRPDAYWGYNGIFYNYDWSEFLFYVGGALIVYILMKISKKKEKNL